MAPERNGFGRPRLEDPKQGQVVGDTPAVTSGSNQISLPDAVAGDRRERMCAERAEPKSDSDDTDAVLDGQAIGPMPCPTQPARRSST